MLSISMPIRTVQAAEYYLELAREDYYTQGGEPPGKWLGEGAQALALNGRVQDDALRNLLAGFSPNGKSELVQNAGSAKRQGAWDLTFSVPKSVSVLWSQADSATRREIEAAQQEAVVAALEYLQHNAGLTRRGSGGLRSERAKLVAASFEHGTSRAQDPNIHTHVLVLNVAVRTDGTTGSIRSDPFFDHKMAAGAVHRAELAARLHARLGVAIERDGDSFKLADVNEELCGVFSQRSQQIKATMAERGVSGPVAASIVTLDTRQVKQHNARELLFDQWRATGRALGWSTAEAKSVLHGPQPDVDLAKARKKVLNEALGRLTEKQSTFAERDFVQAVAEAAPAFGLDAQDVRWIARTRLTQADIVSLKQPHAETLFTTRNAMALEAAFATRLEEARHQPGSPLAAATVEKILAARPPITPTQRAAVESITTAPGTIHTLGGLNRTEMAEVLRAATFAWANEDVPVIALAPDARSAKAFQQRTGIETHSIQELAASRFAGPDAASGERADASHHTDAKQGRGAFKAEGAQADHQATDHADAKQRRRAFKEVKPREELLGKALGVELWLKERSLFPTYTHLPHLEIKLPHLAFGPKKPVLIADQADKLPPWQRRELLLVEKLGIKLVFVTSHRKDSAPWETQGAIARDRRTRSEHDRAKKKAKSQRASPSEERRREEQRRREQAERERQRREQQRSHKERQSMSP